MKTLISDSPIAFDQEVEALQWVIRKRNPYAIRLLVAIEHGANKSLFFPWAEGNLLQFWKRITPRADTFWVRWMAKQFAGLASVIKLIHGPMKAAFGTTDPPAANGYLHRPEERQSTRYGRHGDVKPENILYFLGSENDDDTDHTIVGGPKGILKMSDFGLAAFHSKVSQEVRASRTGRSLTYRGPEHDRELVTAEADLWSFGCVLLEFLVWYQHGIEGVIRFGQNRLEEEKARDPESRYHEDKFFLQSSEPGEAMALKEAVIDVSYCQTF